MKKKEISISLSFYFLFDLEEKSVNFGCISHTIITHNESELNWR